LGGVDSPPAPAEPVAAPGIDGSTAAPPSETAGGAAPSGAGSVAVETAKPASVPGLGVYTIHVASFTEPFRAENEKAYLEKNGFPARIVEVEIKGVKWLRVIVGEFATEDAAAKSRLDLLGLNKVGYARVVTIEAATR
jgi:cell division protein FtsN